MKPVLFSCAAALALAGCMPQTRTVYEPQPAVAMAQLGDNVLWARTDGRRMATDPALRAQGEADKARCEEEATTSGVLQWRAFASCMNRAGYVEMRQPG
ncbi:hypothetical protein NK718_06475 [Alsobacter sp. SYSU M60028]|uniref:Lipoprotein n=1 Tax=Alsobacter ponti TaxID=2962936 RepID=A0ABT1LB24_9HYPH|nr:hypothetical protein [Alsobacter ponti]MCP8938153.1 hypothetical protein [Alsobacter ponti]